MKEYLLDTHTLIWFLNGSPLLPAATRTMIENPRIKCFASVASIWEIGIKQSIGKLQLGLSIHQLGNEIQRAKLELLDIKLAHIDECVRLPILHRDPFDRLLIGQAIAEKLHCISNDQAFSAYPVSV